MRDRLEGVAWACVLVLGAGTVFEVLVALEVLSIGDVPGEGARGSAVVFAASVLALLVACVVSAANGLRARAARSPVWSLLAPAGAAYLVARWFAFDPYYAPTLRRYSEGGVAGEWIVAVVLSAGAAVVLTRRFVRAGSLVTALVVLVEVLTIWVLPLGK